MLGVPLEIKCITSVDLTILAVGLSSAVVAAKVLPAGTVAVALRATNTLAALEYENTAINLLKVVAVGAPTAAVNGTATVVSVLAVSVTE
jgi:hypothetical protein